MRISLFNRISVCGVVLTLGIAAILLGTAPSTASSTPRIDKRFGGDGRIDFTNFRGKEVDENVIDLEVDSDGKVLVLIQPKPSLGFGRTSFLIYRFGRNGSLDRGFGTRGVARVHFRGVSKLSSFTADMVVHSDGRIAVAAPVSGGNKPPGVAVRQMNGRGIPDLRFGRRGQQTIGLTGSGYVLDLRESADGRLGAVVSSLGERGPELFITVSRRGTVSITPNGSTPELRILRSVPSFFTDQQDGPARGGCTVLGDIPVEAYGKGSYLASSGWRVNASVSEPTNGAISLVDENGQFIATFGQSGTHVSPDSIGCYMGAVVAADSSIVGLGYAISPDYGEVKPKLSLVSPGGQLDQTFGSGGVLDLPGIGMPVAQSGNRGHGAIAVRDDRPTTGVDLSIIKFRY